MRCVPARKLETGRFGARTTNCFRPREGSLVAETILRLWERLNRLTRLQTAEPQRQSAGCTLLLS